MNILEIMRARHSVRQYTTKPIEQEKRDVLDTLCGKLNEESGLNMQILYDEPNCFNSIRAHYGKIENVSNYISIVGKKGRELDYKAGYYGEELVLKAQEIGLNTCWVKATHGKSAAGVNPGEKETVIIALGYGATQGEPHQDKPRKKLVNEPAMAPDWFEIGVEAAMLAPTAMNQQRFKISLEGDEPKITAPIGVLTKMDLGIVKYHFEAATGRKVK